MNKIAGAISMLLIIFSLTGNLAMAQKASKKKTTDQSSTEKQVLELISTKDSISYIIGRDIGRNMVQNEIEINEIILKRGFSDGLNGVEGVISDEAIERIMMAFQQEMMMKHQMKSMAAASEARAEGEAFLAKNKNQPGVVTLPSGLQYKVITEGSGNHPEAEDVVEVHYTGTLIDGTVFDSSVDRGETIKFPLNGVIAGWTEGVQLMTPGAKYIFYIPSDLAYGDRETGPIKAGSTLIFEVELISIEKK